MSPLFLSGDRGILHDGARRFDPRKLAWTTLETPAPDSVSVSPAEAVRWLYEEANARMVPIGVIGPRRATERQFAIAEQLGRRLGELRIPLLNGGTNGALEAGSNGCEESAGFVLDGPEANRPVSSARQAGRGPGRTIVIARAGQALVAIGGEYGTLSEMAFGLQFDKPVFTLEDAPEVDGAQPMESVEDVMSALLSVILQLPRPS